MKLTGLIAAVHTPFDEKADLDLSIVERQCAHLSADGVSGVFVGGSTGESHSLTLLERRALSERWANVMAGSGMKFVVHVGSNCLDDARNLAQQAQALGADAIAALAPSYFKPGTVGRLVECCAEIASAAPETPFYFYDIPALTGVNLSMPEFISRAIDVIPNFRGIKFTNLDLMSYQICLEMGVDVPWGVDESLLGALALGAIGGVGSSYNFAAPIYLEIIRAAANGEPERAREYQMRSVKLIQLLASYGYMAAAKATMGMIGVPVGQPRLPNGSLTEEQTLKLRLDLEALGFFDWLTR